MTANAPRIRTIAHTLEELDDAAIEREFLTMNEDDRWLLLFAVMRENRAKITQLDQALDQLRPLWVRITERAVIALGVGIAVLIGERGGDLR